jgi:hypothetical protein
MTYIHLVLYYTIGNILQFQPFQFFNIVEFIASIGNSIKGPITNTNDIIGCNGNVIIAIASDTGELRADVVKINDIIF